MESQVLNVEEIKKEIADVPKLGRPDSNLGQIQQTIGRYFKNALRVSLI